jgi:1,4-alpha-glucan branching enzyme
MRQADFVLLLHSHLPFVLHHGRWPHGSDWLCEAAVETYLPLLAQLQGLAAGNVAAPVTLGFTPVLAAQLSHPDLASELDGWLAQRRAHCEAAPAAMRGTPDEPLIPLVAFWAQRLRRLQALWLDIGRDLPGAFRQLQDAGRLELMTSAATHALLPLLGRDESIRLQLAIGRDEHRRTFDRDAAGCWLPECAYRPRGRWSPMPGIPNAGVRRGIEEHLADAGFDWFCVDAHMAHAGAPLGLYGDRATAHTPRPAAPRAPAGPATYSPYRAWRVGAPRATGSVATFVRDPASTLAVWSRHDGYPGDAAFLEFHKIRWPGGLRLWRVTDRNSDLGAKAPYDPAMARARAWTYGRDYAGRLAALAHGEAAAAGSVIVAPFDTELFGHWWFEGPDFLGDLYRALPEHPGVHATTATAHLAGHPPRAALKVGRGSWGRDGDWSMWMNDRVSWVWPVIWEMENRFWDCAPDALSQPHLHPILAQAARSLLLLQSSDWPFIITTGDASDYGAQRFRGHAHDTRQLLDVLAEGLRGGDVAGGHALARTLGARDDLFPDVVAAIGTALQRDAGGIGGGSRAPLADRVAP